MSSSSESCSRERSPVSNTRTSSPSSSFCIVRHMVPPSCDSETSNTLSCSTISVWRRKSKRYSVAGCSSSSSSATRSRSRRRRRRRRKKERKKEEKKEEEKKEEEEEDEMEEEEKTTKNMRKNKKEPRGHGNSIGMMAGAHVGFPFGFVNTDHRCRRGCARAEASRRCEHT